MYVHAHNIGGGGFSQKTCKKLSVHIVHTTHGIDFDGYVRALCGSKPGAASLGWRKTDAEPLCRLCAARYARDEHGDPKTLTPGTWTPAQIDAIQVIKTPKAAEISRRQVKLLQQAAEAEGPILVKDGTFSNTIASLVKNGLLSVSWNIAPTRKGRDYLFRLSESKK